MLCCPCMKIQSLVREQDSLVPVEVEITLLPGLPQIQFLGLPDQMIRESVHRIRSAIKWQGFETPRAKQILVNLRPAHLKKSSRGLELAVAAGILWKTEQVATPKSLSELLVYGELGLEGDVREPEDLALAFDGRGTVLTGRGGVSEISFPRRLLSQLKDLENPEFKPASLDPLSAERPEEALKLSFPLDQARLLEIVAVGEHPVLLAGPSGSGKTTLARSLSSFLKAPSREDLRSIRKVSRAPARWRPVVQPHHSSTPLSLIGGGVPPMRGEISRAHLGILILDEWLEFDRKAQEILREPIEDGKIRISRLNAAMEFPAEALVIACTNLCPCGNWTPKTSRRCQRTISYCRSYLNRMSGPMTDRFQILFFTEKSRKGEVVEGMQILKRVAAAQNFCKSRRSCNARLTRDEILKDVDPFLFENLYRNDDGSYRRELATLRVARTLADLDLSQSIEKHHLENALTWTRHSFEHLKGLD